MSSRLASFATVILLATSGALASPARRDLSIPSTLPSSWTSLGCYTDDVSDRTLNIISMSDASGMTGDECISYCGGKGYSFAGTEYSQQCFCSNSLNTDASAADESSCNMACSGDATQACGGAGFINVYSTSSGGGSAPSTAQSIGDWSYAGCYSDVVGARTLLNQVTLDSTTNEGCTAACQAQGYTLAGTEYADECYCGNEFSNGGTSEGSGCNMVCSGSSSEYCGGSNRLTVYSYS
ncbi:WSC-domain-containing protein, partial [Schizopora paradoxa]